MPFINRAGGGGDPSIGTTDASMWEVIKNKKFVSNGKLITGMLSPFPDKILNKWSANIPTPLTGTHNILDIVAIDDLLVATCHQGNVLLSNDNGLSWFSPTSAMPIAQNLISIANVDGVLVAITDLYRVIRSVDKGYTWSLDSYTLPFAATRLFNANGILIVHGANGGMLRSSDAGLTWSEQITNPFGTSVIVSMAYAKDVIIAVGYNGKIARSTDNGLTWGSLISGPFASSAIISILYINGVVILGSNNKIARSTDLGLTFGPLVPHSFTTPEQINYLLNINGVAAVLTVSGKMSFSTDTGLTWSEEVISPFGGSYTNTKVFKFIDGVVFAAGTNPSKWFFRSDSYDPSIGTTDAIASNILKDKTAIVNGVKLIGNLQKTTQIPLVEGTLYSTGIVESNALPFPPAPDGTQNQDAIITSSAGTVPTKFLIQSSAVGVTADKVAKGQSIMGINGIYTFDATAVDADMLTGKTAYVNGNKITGNIPIAPTYPSNNTATGFDVYSNKTSANSIHSVFMKIPKGYYNETWVGVDEPNLTPTNVKAGVTIGSGVKVTGSFTSDATAVFGDMLSGKTAYVNGNKITGTISSKSAQTYTPSTSNQTIAAGQYLSGVQTIAGSTNLISSNIKNGVNIFGVVGTIREVQTPVAGSILFSVPNIYGTQLSGVTGVKINTQAVYNSLLFVLRPQENTEEDIPWAAPSPGVYVSYSSGTAPTGLQISGIATYSRSVLFYNPYRINITVNSTSWRNGHSYVTYIN